MGKVGSSSLEKAIPGSVHSHTLYNNSPNPHHLAMRFSAPERYFRMHVLKALKRSTFRRSGQVDIITVIRDPLQRNISMFFQGLPFWLAYAQAGYKGRGLIDPRGEGIDVLLDCFDKSFNHSYPIEWMDREVKKFTGIDVYQQEYDADKGFMTCEQGRFRLLLVNIKSLSKVVPDIENFLQQEIVLTKNNAAENKWYADAYTQFKKNYQPSDRVKEILYQSKFWEKFFSEE